MDYIDDDSDRSDYSTGDDDSVNDFNGKNIVKVLKAIRKADSTTTSLQDILAKQDSDDSSSSEKDEDEEFLRE